MNLLEKSFELTQKVYNSPNMSYEPLTQLEKDLYYIYYHPDASIFPPGKDYQIILPYSGGPDSFVGYYFAKKKFENVLPLFVNYGQPYAKEELRSIETTPFYSEIETVDVSKLMTFENQSVWGEIFPSRNWIFCVLAAEKIKSMGSIWICTHEGEVKTLWGDKSQYLINKGSEILSNHFNKHIKIEYPFQYRTKAEMIKWYIDEGLPIKELTDRVSCHNFIDGKPCGSCMGCGCRYVAMEKNGIKEEYVGDILECSKTYYSNYEKSPLCPYSRDRMQEAKEILYKEAV